MPRPTRSQGALLGAILAGGLLLASAGADAEEPESPPLREGPVRIDAPRNGVGRLVPDLGWRAVDGRSGRISDLVGDRGLLIAFHNVGCPVGRRYAAELARLEGELAERGFGLLLVDPSPQDDAEEIGRAARERGLGAPWTQDPEGELRGALDAASTTEVFLLDAARTLVYRGAIDDRHGLGYSLPEPRRRFLRDAVDAVADGRVPEVRATTAPGCALRRDEAPLRQAGPVTWHGRVSRILQERCQTCHRPGESGPFPLIDYEDAAGNAEMLAQVVERRTMPPWYAPEGDHRFANDPSLTEAERRDLLRWVADDCPLGDPSEAPLPRRWPTGWRVGEPDLVLRSPVEFEVEAEGVLPYRNVRVPTELAEDRWVRGFEVRTDHPDVVHHILVFLEYPKDHPRAPDAPDYADGLAGYFAALVPGQGHLVYPEGTARFLPRGAVLRFQIHYTPNGKAVRDRPRIGLLLADREPAHEMRSRGVFNVGFAIPPGAARHEVTGFWQFPRDARIVAFMPHMHLRGTAFRYELVYPDGRTEVALEVPRYAFDWQIPYQLREPIEVPAGTVVRATGTFDNSEANPANPDPRAWVRFGRQTTEEMMIGYLDWY